MSWVEELKPDDDVEVEIIYPREYVDYSFKTIGKYARGLAMLCKGMFLLGEEEIEFPMRGVTVVQIQAIENLFEQFGINLTHTYEILDGDRYVHFYANLRGL